MLDFAQHLRERTLDIVKEKSTQEKADALNLLEAIIDGEMATDELIDAIGNGTVPVRYVPKGTQGGHQVNVVELESGYLRAQVSHSCWAQWPKDRDPTADDVFEPRWNAQRFLKAWAKYKACSHEWVGCDDGPGCFCIKCDVDEPGT